MKKFLSLFWLIAIAWLCSVAYAETVDDVITASNLAATTTTYTDFSNVTISSGAVYAGYSAKATSGAIQLRSNNSNSGIVSTTSVGKVRKVVLEWTPSTENASNDGKQLDVYGKKTAYAAASELYKTSTRGTKLGSITYGTTTELVITEDYEYIGLRSYNGSIYLTSITITWEKAELTAPVISGVKNGKEYINEATVNISKPNNATISYTVKKDGVVVDEATDAKAEFSKTYTELGTYTVSASATYGTNTLTAEDVTFTIKSNKVTSIAEFLAIAPNHQDIDFVFDCNLIVTYAKTDSKNLYVRDETGAPLLIYMDNKASTQFEYVPENGDFFDRGVKGKYKLYNTIQELVNPTFPLCNAHQAAAEPKVITIGAAADNMSQYVKIENVKFNSTTEIACGEETLAVTGSAPTDRTAQYTVVGVITYSDSTVKLNVVSYEELKVLGTPEIEVTGETNATGFYLDKAMLKFVYPANATSMEYVVKKGETVLGQAEGLTEDATLDITTCGEISIKVTATNGTDQTNESKTIKIIPSAPTVSLAAGTYHEAQTLKITAPEGAKLDGLLGETDIENVSEFTTTLAAVNEETTTYELYVCSTKDGVSSDPVSATFVINPNVIENATVTGDIVFADQDAAKFIAKSSSMKKDTDYILTDNLNNEYTITSTIGAGKTTYPLLQANGTLRLYNTNGNVIYISNNNITITKVAISHNRGEITINDNSVAATDGVSTWNAPENCHQLTIIPTTSEKNTDVSAIAITYVGTIDYYKVKDGAALIGMEKGKFYQVNVALEGVEANGGVLYARTTEASVAPSKPRENHTGFDSYEDGYGYKNGEFDQRDWVAIKGLGSEYEGFALGTFIAAYDGEKLTSVVSNPSKGDQPIDITNINTFGVANVFYGNYENTSDFGWIDRDGNPYYPFFVKAKVNEVANFVGKVTKDTSAEGGSFRLEGSGKCGVFEGKGVLLEAADGVSLSVSGEEYKQFTGVLVAETNNTLAQYDVKIVALSAPTTPTGVAALKADGKATVYGTEGAVVVNGADGKVMIFDAMGRMVKSVNAEGAATVAMPAGYYIVRTAGTAAKVMVK